MAIIWEVQNGNSTWKIHFSVGQHWGCWSNSAPKASSVFMDYPKMRNTEAENSQILQPGSHSLPFQLPLELMEHYCQVSHTWFDFFVCSHQKKPPECVSPDWAPSVTELHLQSLPPKHRTRLWECSPQVRGAFTCPPENSSQISSCFWPLGETSGFSWMGDLNLFHNRRLDRTKWVWDKLIPSKFPQLQLKLITSCTSKEKNTTKLQKKKKKLWWKQSKPQILPFLLPTAP